MKLIPVNPGSFLMGSPETETILTCDTWDERPVHRVRISQPLLMAETEVTNAQYEQFDPSHRKWRGLRGVSVQDNEAVTHVSWDEAVAFCRWLSQKEGRPYRLPTEAEWEYACRAGTTTPFWSGLELAEDQRLNQWEETGSKQLNTKDKLLRELKGKVPVSLVSGEMHANPWGFRGMHGVVEEWVMDWYGPYNPDDQSDPAGPEEGMFRVTRGGSHNTSLKYLRSANRSASLPGDKNWIIGFRVVQAELPDTRPRGAVPMDMNDPGVLQAVARWSSPSGEALFTGPVPFVIPDTSHPLLSELPHHHCPTITWCDNGDLLAAWFNTISEIGREMVIVSSRLRYSEGSWASDWDTERLFFAPADRNTTGSCLVNDGHGRLYYFNSISESGHHRDQCLMMSISEDHGASWSCPRIISDLSRRHKLTVMNSYLVEDNGNRLVLGVDYAPVGTKAAFNGGGGVIISEDRGHTWASKVIGKSIPVVGEGLTGGLAAGFHIGLTRLNDGRLLAMARHHDSGNSDINGHTVSSYSSDEGDGWTYSESPFRNIGSGQRLVLMRLNEGPLLFASFGDQGIYLSLSFDDGENWSAGKHLADRSKGYMDATQTPDNMIHLITSREYFRFNLPWILQQQ